MGPVQVAEAHDAGDGRLALVALLLRRISKGVKAAGSPEYQTASFMLSANLSILTGKSIDTEPLNVPDALRKPHWKAAIEAEMAGLMSNKTFIVVRLPVGIRGIPTKFIFKVKLDAHGNLLKYKARLVAQGFHQVEGVDFTQSYAPVAHAAAVRMLMAIATMMKMRVTHVDGLLCPRKALSTRWWLGSPRESQSGTGWRTYLQGGKKPSLCPSRSFLRLSPTGSGCRFWGSG